MQVLVKLVFKFIFQKQIVLVSQAFHFRGKGIKTTASGHFYVWLTAHVIGLWKLSELVGNQESAEIFKWH